MILRTLNYRPVQLPQMACIDYNLRLMINTNILKKKTNFYELEQNINPILYINGED